ncbi:MAG: GNAT family N-acetyltransferase [Clostridia bacterium]|nr:GNAT family N-acetyltransferase [Clostridia bacterium]
MDRLERGSDRQCPGGRSIPYVGVLDGRVICEATALPLQGGEGMAKECAVELCAFRTVREYRRMGYFSKLMAFMLEDLKKRGYTKAVVGVEPEEKTNRDIYRRWGFDEPAGTGKETYPDGTVIEVEFYSKRLG